MKASRCAVLSLLAVSASALRISAEENERTGWVRGLSVQVYGGLSRVSGTDLDIPGRAEAQWFDYTRLRGWDSTHSSDNRFSWTASGERDLSFAPLRDPVVMGFRLRRDLGKEFALSLGLEYLARDQLTDIDQSYRITDGRPNRVFYPSQYTARVRYPDYLVSLRAWAPQLALHAGLPMGRFVGLSFSAAGGPLFVRSRLVDESYLRTTHVTGEWSEVQSLVEMKGKGIGWVVALGAQLRIGRLGPLTLIVEGGYAFRRADHIEGSSRWEERYLDSKQAPTMDSGSVNGVWQVSRGPYGDTLGVDTEPGSRDFVLDLSGLEFRAGLSVSLSGPAAR